MRTVLDVLREISTAPDFYGQVVTSVHVTNGHGDMPLHIAASSGDCEAIGLLVAAGADINARGEHGFTPLHCAAEQDNEPAVRLLLELGASITANNSGDTPQQLAKLLGNQRALTGFSRDI